MPTATLPLRWSLLNVAFFPRPNNHVPSPTGPDRHLDTLRSLPNCYYSPTGRPDGRFPEQEAPETKRPAALALPPPAASTGRTPHTVNVGRTEEQPSTEQGPCREAVTVRSWAQPRGVHQAKAAL